MVLRASAFCGSVVVVLVASSALLCADVVRAGDISGGMDVSVGPAHQQQRRIVVRPSPTINRVVHTMGSTAPRITRSVDHSGRSNHSPLTRLAGDAGDRGHLAKDSHPSDSQSVGAPIDMSVGAPIAEDHPSYPLSSGSGSSQDSTPVSSPSSPWTQALTLIANAIFPKGVSVSTNALQTWIYDDQRAPATYARGGLVAVAGEFLRETISDLGTLLTSARSATSADLSILHAEVQKVGFRTERASKPSETGRLSEAEVSDGLDAPS